LFNVAGDIVYSIVGLVTYLYLAYCLRAIARRRGLPHPWLAWIPIVNVYLLCRCACRRLGSAIAFFIGFGVVTAIAIALPFNDTLITPLMNAVLSAVVFVKLSRRLGRNMWWGLLLLVPFLNLVVIWVFAFSSPRKRLSGLPSPVPSG
jgi:hypothetical protein